MRGGRDAPRTESYCAQRNCAGHPELRSCDCGLNIGRKWVYSSLLVDEEVAREILSPTSRKGRLFMTEAFLLGGSRTPVGRYGGQLAPARPDDLAALVMAESLRRARLEPGVVDEVILGNANGAGEENRNVARMAWLLNGFPDEVPGVSVNRLCASGMSAIVQASQMIKAGAADVVVVGGVESMSRAPWVMAKPERSWAKPGAVFDTSLGWRFTNPRFEGNGDLSRDGKLTYSMPETAEEVAGRFYISREDADTFAASSHERALDAMRAGRLTSEIVPVTVPSKRGTGTVVDSDEGPRDDSTLEVLAELRSIVRSGGVVTAGNSSSLNDGASAIVVVSERAVETYSLQPEARVVHGAAAGVAPEIMGMGPVPATYKVFDRIGWSVADLDAVELNEAFATQALAVMRELRIDEGVVNVDGGAIALGHPLGSSGCRIVVTLVRRMREEHARRGLATMCVGVGQGMSVALEAA